MKEETTFVDGYEGAGLQQQQQTAAAAASFDCEMRSKYGDK
jgi:hypothetical protein